MKKWDLNNTTGKETACIVGKSSYRSSRNYIHVEKYPPLYDTSMPISDRSLACLINRRYLRVDLGTAIASSHSPASNPSFAAPRTTENSTSM